MEKSRNTALVTGGTRGIGRAIAERLIKDGLKCIVTGRNVDPPDSTPHGCEYFKADLMIQNDVDSLAMFIEKEKPCVLVNNVGLNIKGATGDFLLNSYDDILNVNLRAPFILSKSALKGMESAGWGRIVNITSLWGVTGNINNAAYCASKFGLDGLTVSLAAEYAKNGILINAVAPGYILTENAKEAFTKEALNSISSEIPVGRLGNPEEVASLVSWLVSVENTYMTGQNLLIDGGLTRTAHP